MAIEYQLLPCKYNNYYNRYLKRESSVAAYKAFKSGTLQQKWNYDPRDGVDASWVLNASSRDIEKADYAVVIKITDGVESIESRWFIIECSRTCTGQYFLNVHRDTAADDFDNIQNSPMYIEKATLSNKNDPAIYNSEDVSVNQIKTSETLLKDETGCAWVVGYIPQDAFSTSGEQEITFSYPLEGSADFTVADLSEVPFYSTYGNKTFKSDSRNMTFAVYAYNEDRTIYNYMISAGFYWNGSDYKYTEDTYNESIDGMTTPAAFSGGLTFTPFFSSIDEQNIVSSWRLHQGVNFLDFPDISNKLTESIESTSGCAPESTINAMKANNGRFVYNSTTKKYYKIIFTESSNLSNSIYSPNTTQLSYLNQLYKTTIYGKYKVSGTGLANNYKIKVYYKQCTYELVEQPQAESTVKIDLTNKRYHLVDQPFDIFCMPYSNDLKIYHNGTLEYTSDQFLALAVGTNLTAAVGSGKVYDCQLLPYCPVRYCIQSDGTFDYKDAYTSTIKNAASNITIGKIFWANSSNFTFNINYELSLDEPNTYYDSEQKRWRGNIPDSGLVRIDLSSYSVKDARIVNTTYPYISAEYVPETDTLDVKFDVKYAYETVEIYYILTLINYGKKATVEDWKVANQCDLYRLCSPNYDGQFQFTLTKNGPINYFNVDCTYKPYSPYIHVNPNFGRLYGHDFNDARGLICGGDFSLPRVESSWANYVQNNKNYESIFRREIQNIELTQDVERLQQGLNIGTSGISAGIGVGTLINPVVGVGMAAASIAGGIGDYQIAERLRNETLNYKHDMFKMQLGNIKAIPYSLSKVGAFNFNNKLFPFIEYYTCTETEKQALRNKMKYNGMSIYRIGTINEFILNDYTYIKGQLIRSEVANDYHYVNTLADELNKGLYMKR